MKKLKNGLIKSHFLKARQDYYESKGCAVKWGMEVKPLLAKCAGRLSLLQ